MTGASWTGAAVGTLDASGYGIHPPGFRLPDATHVGAVTLQVSDLDRSLAYYRDLLGFRVFRQDGGRATLGAADDDTPLVHLVERPGVAPALRGARRLGLYHFAILLPDRAALGRVLAHLERTGTYVGMSDHAVSEALYLSDPDGLGIEIYADRPRSAWQRNGNELAMTTIPLHVPDVLGAGGGAPWTGMPKGTTIGHVHLHVGDIDAAAAFYHAALGLDAVVWSYPGALFLSAGGYHHHLGVNTWAGPSARRPAEDDARLLYWDLVLPDAGAVNAAARSLEGAGHQVEGADDGSRVATDPWGTSLRLVSPR